VAAGCLHLLPVAARQPPVTASNGWVALPASGATSADAFVVVDNPTMYDVYLVAATADAADKVEFREGADASAAAKPVREVTVPAYGSVAMSPAGIHLVLSSLTKTLSENDTVTLTLTTDSSQTIEVRGTVRRP
jgi:hypothetical protein